MVRENSSFTVILADDDPDDRLFTEKAFNEIDLSVTLRTAENGEDLLQYLGQCIAGEDRNCFLLPDLILLDLNMPKKNGWETLEEIKRFPELQEVPVVIWTTSGSEEDRLRSIEMGADYFITKPCNYSHLLSSVNSLVRIFCGKNEKEQEREFHFKNLKTPAV